MIYQPLSEECMLKRFAIYASFKRQEPSYRPLSHFSEGLLNPLSMQKSIGLSPKLYTKETARSLPFI